MTHRGRFAKYGNSVILAALLIAITSILLTQVKAVQQYYIRTAEGLPLTAKAQISTDCNLPISAVAINENGQVHIFVTSFSDTAGHTTQHLEGPYLIGRDRGFVRPIIQPVEIDGDGQIDLALILEGEVFAYRQVSFGVFELNTALSPLAVEALTSK